MAYDPFEWEREERRQAQLDADYFGDLHAPSCRCEQCALENVDPEDRGGRW